MTNLIKRQTVTTAIFILLISLVSSDQSPNSSEDGKEVETEPLLIAEIIESIFSKTTLATKSPNRRDISFLLYKSDGNWNKLDVDNTQTFKSSGLKANKPYKIAIHGFLANCSSSDYPETIFKAYLAMKADYNLICVDWGPLANPILPSTGLLHYPKAINYAIFVGDEIAKFIKEGLIKNGYLNNTSDVHLIGHSLGGHIAGVCGDELAKNKLKVGRITGLDPAGPYFFLKEDDAKCKLSKSDADFVDVIHSNMGLLGSRERLGHVSFLPNGGGKFQPHCLTTNGIEDLHEKVTGSCSHRAAIYFFEKSIRQKINACSCKSWSAFKKTKKTCKKSFLVRFGDKVPSKTRGVYCLDIKK